MLSHSATDKTCLLLASSCIIAAGWGILLQASDHFLFCRSLLLPRQEAAQSAEPELEIEDADDPVSQHASEPTQPVREQGQPATTGQHMSAGDAMDIDATGDANTAVSQARQSSTPQTATSASNREADGPAAQASHRGNGASAKPSRIARGSNSVQRNAVPKSYAFVDAGSIKAALADAWSAEGDIGKQMAALYELFGDGILPYVPMLPCVS